jgi:protein involved in polysaccharide export with SLBB domain
MLKSAYEKPEFEGTFWFRMLEPKLVGESDIQVGSVFKAGVIKSQVVVVENDKARQDMWISLIERSPEYLLSDFLETLQLAPWPLHPAYLAVNKRRTRVTVGIDGSMVHALIGNVAIAQRKYGFRSSNRWNALEHMWEKVTDGFDGATLAEVNYQEVARFSLPLTVYNFSFKRVTAEAKSVSKKGFYSVSGDVNRVGDFNLFPNETVINALRAAGGVSDQADLRRVELRRLSADGTTSTIKVDVESWLDGDGPPGATIPSLESGDAIYVPSISSP